jgi:hypothetical protein
VSPLGSGLDAWNAEVAGVSFVPGYPDNLLGLVDHVVLAQQRGEGMTALLIRNPDNQHDANAIEVHAPAMGEGLIGHLPRQVAAWVAPRMDAGEVWAAEVLGVRIHSDHPLRPGVEIRLWQVHGAS